MYGNFCEEKVSAVSPPALIGENFVMLIIFFFCVKDCMEDIETFTALAKIFFCNPKAAGLGEIFIHFHIIICVQYMKISMDCCIPPVSSFTSVEMIGLGTAYSTLV